MPKNKGAYSCDVQTGTGSIVKLSGNRRRPYIVKISARDKDGYVRQVALSYHAKLQEAQEALEEYNRKAAAGRPPVRICSPGPWNRSIPLGRSGSTPGAGNPLLPPTRHPGTSVSLATPPVKCAALPWTSGRAILDEGEDEGRSQSSINNDAI